MMNNQMEELMGQLEVAESLEQMVSIEDEIAAMIGKGFLDGKFDYTFLMRTKEQVEQREKQYRKCRQMVKSLKQLCRGQISRRLNLCLRCRNIWQLH